MENKIIINKSYIKIVKIIPTNKTINLKLKKQFQNQIKNILSNYR
jgi:hypothetical protein